MTEKAEPSKRTLSYFSLVTIFITVVLSLIAITLGFSLYQSQDSTALPYMLIGGIGLALSVYMLFQNQKKKFKVILKTPRVITTILCQKCGFKNIRDFQRGDYIFKEIESCPKCNEKMMITSIYREVTEKEK